MFVLPHIIKSKYIVSLTGCKSLAPRHTHSTCAEPSHISTSVSFSCSQKTCLSSRVAWCIFKSHRFRTSTYLAIAVLQKKRQKTDLRTTISCTTHHLPVDEITEPPPNLMRHQGRMLPCSAWHTCSDKISLDEIRVPHHDHRRLSQKYLCQFSRYCDFEVVTSVLFLSHLVTMAVWGSVNILLTLIPKFPAPNNSFKSRTNFDLST